MRRVQEARFILRHAPSLACCYPHRDMAASWLDYRRGEENGNARFSVEHVRTIRRLANHGSSTRTLAHQFGIGKTTAWQVIAYATWRHVDDGL